MTTKLRRDGAPPVAPRRTDHPRYRQELHGEILRDPLAWLRERDDPQVLEHLRAENAYTDAAMADTEAQQKTLYDEMVARIEEDDVTVPVRLGGHWYYERRRAGKQYALHCRRPARPKVPPDESYDADASEEILLDLDEMHEAEGLSYLRLGGFRPSPCGRLLAYSVDTAGHERFEVRILDLETREHLDAPLVNAAHSLAWGRTRSAEGLSEILYYVTRDEAQRPHCVMRHRLGVDPADDEMLWREDDERFFVGLRSARSGRYILVSAGSHTTSEVRLLDADDPAASLRLLTGRRQGVEFQADHHPGDDEQGIPERFFLLTNLDAPEFRLVELPGDLPADPAPESWRDVVSHDPSIHLEAVLVLRRHLVLSRRVKGLPSIRVFDLTSRDRRFEDVRFDDEAHDAHLGSHPELDTRVLRLEYQTQVKPLTTLDIDLSTGDRLLSDRRERKVEVVHGYDASLYESHRLVAVARDGVEIPVDVVYRRDRSELLDDTPGPLLLYGYGAYGHSLEAKFHPNIVSLLDRGWGFALAHVRGGGEMGKHWHEAGRVERKENTFYDFVACAETLVAEGLTTPRRLAIRGGSAGGLLVGATLNLRPDLFHAAIADVPFVDVLQTMLDPTLPLTVIEFEEWGDPESDVAAFGRIRGYSPIENVREAPYPHLLVTAGLHDPRVQYWEPAKWVQVLREKTTDGGLTLLRVHLEAGHGGASGRYEYLEQEAHRQAFLIAALATQRLPGGTARPSGGDARMPQSSHG